MSRGLVRFLLALIVVIGSVATVCGQVFLDADSIQKTASSDSQISGLGIRAPFDQLHDHLRPDQMSHLKEHSDHHSGAHQASRKDFPGSWEIPNTETRFKIGGYVKLDAIYDFNEIGNRFNFLTPTIPTTIDNGGRTTFHARQSRIFFETRTDTRCGNVKTYLETDFFGTGNALRLRHAYAQVGGLLVGQTWTLFMDISAHPFTLDFEGPPGMVFRRQAQIRYTVPINCHSKLAFAVENPSSAVGFPGGGTNLDRSPDFVVSWRHENARGHVQIAGIARDIGFRADAGPTASIDQHEFGYGASVSGLVKLAHKDNLKCQVAWGKGIGDYFEDLNSGGVNTDGVSDIAGNLELLNAFGFFLAHQHWWNACWRSNLVYGYGNVENIAGQPGTDFNQSEYVAVNTVYSPIKNIDIGLEYLFGTNRDAANNEGQANRLQFSTVVRF